MLRVVTGIPIAYILIPGYALALGLSFVVPPIFVGIAFDSGGRGQRPDDHDLPAAAEHRRVRNAGRQCDDGCFWRGGAGRADPADRRAADGRRLPNEDEPRRETAAPAFDGRDEIVELEEEWA